jgi:hypothetical protein
MTTDTRYWAFVSYNGHDEALATALHRKLETYRIPRDYVGRDTGFGRLPERLYPCFRDREELPGAPHLRAEIRRALSCSHTLVVVCSPNAAASTWVNDEIRYFRSLGRADRIFAYLVQGEPRDALPPALTEAGSEDEPLAADARPTGDGRHAAFLKLVAGITSIPYVELTQRDKVRRVRQRTIRRMIAGATALAILISYLLLADAGAPLPLSDATRVALDHFGISILRPVQTDQQLEASADDLRAQLLASNFAYLQKDWGEFLPGPHNSLDVWSTAQYAAADLRSRSGSLTEARAYLQYLSAAFAPGVFHRSLRGEAYGWYGYSDPAPWPEAALWTAIASIDALEFPHLLSPSDRRLWLGRLRLAQQASDSFGPHDGHWDVMPHEEDASQYDTYAAAMGLAVALSARHAGLGWDGSASRRDQIGRQTATWLLRTWLPAGNPLPRWNPDNQSADFVDYAGLTLQIYGELLEAQRVGHVALPRAMNAAIEKRLLALSQAQVEGDRSQVTFIAHFVDEHLHDQLSARHVGFAMLSGAILCTARYLEYLRRTNAPRERVAPISRVASRLLVITRNLATDTSFDRFVPAEAAYYLSAFDELRPHE